MAWSLLASNAAQLAVNLLFLPMVAAVRTVGAFSVFVLLNVMTLTVVYYRLVETKDLPPEDILDGLLRMRGLQPQQPLPMHSEHDYDSKVKQLSMSAGDHRVQSGLSDEKKDANVSDDTAVANPLARPQVRPSV